MAQSPGETQADERLRKFEWKNARAQEGEGSLAHKPGGGQS